MFFILPKIVTPKICDEIVKDCKKNALIEAKVGQQESEFVNDSQIRKTSVHFIKDGDNKINELVWGFIRKANNKQFHYDLDYFQPVQFAEYKGSENYRAFYDWHQDYDGSSTSGEGRKLSLTLALSDPDTYEGGELQFYSGGRPFPDVGEIKGEQVMQDIKSQGTVIIFDSRDWHRVSPMVSGVRHSIVCWCVGPNFK